MCRVPLGDFSGIFVEIDCCNTIKTVANRRQHRFHERWFYTISIKITNNMHGSNFPAPDLMCKWSNKVYDDSDRLVR